MTEKHRMHRFGALCAYGELNSSSKYRAIVAREGNKNAGHNLASIHRQFGALSCEHRVCPRNRNCARSAFRSLTAIDVSKTNYIQHLSTFSYLNGRA